jgi:hypothetical protein
MPENMAPKHFEQISTARTERQYSHLVLSGNVAAPQFGQFRLAGFTSAAPEQQIGPDIPRL